MTTPGAIRAGGAAVEITARERLSAGLQAAQQRLQQWGASIRRIGLATAGVGVAIAAPLAVSVRTFGRMGDELDKMSRRTGLSVEALSEYAVAAELAGATSDDLERALRRQSQTILNAANGLSGAQRTLQLLGLTAADLQRLSVEDQFLLIAERLDAIPDPGRRAAIALEVFGRSGTALLPMMEGGRRGMIELRNEARRLGLTVSTEAAASAAEYTDAMTLTTRAARALRFEIGGALAPAVTRVLTTIGPVIAGLREWVSQNRGVVAGAAALSISLIAIGAALITIGPGLTGFVAGMKIWAGATSAVIAVTGALAGLLSLKVIALAAAGAAVLALAQRFLGLGGVVGRVVAFVRERVSGLAEPVQRVVRVAVNALLSGEVEAAAEVLWAGVLVVWTRATNSLTEPVVRVSSVIMRVWANLQIGLAAAAQTGLAGVQSVWVRTSTFVQNVWTVAMNAVMNRFERVVGAIMKGWLRVQSIFDADLDYSAAAELLDQQVAEKIREREAAAAALVGGRDAAAAAELARIKQESEAVLAALGKELEDRQRAIAEGVGDRVAEAQDALEDAKRRLDEAIASAEAATESEAATRRRADAAGDPGELLARAGDAVRGLFNVSALQSLQTGSRGSEERTADNTRRTAEAAEEMVTLLRNTGPGPIFT